MKFQVVDHLAEVELAQSGRLVGVHVLALQWRTATHSSVESGDLSTHAIVLTMFGLSSGESVEPDSVRQRLPSEIEERVHWLYLDPPAASLKSLSDELRIITGHHNVLVTVLDIGILERNLRLLLLNVDWIAIEVSWRLLRLQLLDQVLRYAHGAIPALHQELASVLDKLRNILVGRYLEELLQILQCLQSLKLSLVIIHDVYLITGLPHHLTPLHGLGIPIRLHKLLTEHHVVGLNLDRVELGLDDHVQTVWVNVLVLREYFSNDSLLFSPQILNCLLQSVYSFGYLSLLLVLKSAAMAHTGLKDVAAFLHSILALLRVHFGHHLSANLGVRLRRLLTTATFSKRLVLQDQVCRSLASLRGRRLLDALLHNCALFMLLLGDRHH